MIKLAPESPASSGAYDRRAKIRSACPDQRLWDLPLAVESASKACQLTDWKDVDCIMTLAVAHGNSQEFDAAAAAIDKAIAVLKPDDKRTDICKSMRDSFRVAAQQKLHPAELFPE